MKNIDLKFLGGKDVSFVAKKADELFNESLEGKIHAPIIRVSGSVKGSLHASRLLELLAEARVEGDLNTPPGGLSMESGGAFEGKFVITPGTVSSGNDSVGG